MAAGTSYRAPDRVLPQMSGFVGREAELADVRELLRASRLGTITGPGGVGKTRLALCAADQAGTSFRAGAHLIDLSTVHDPKLLASALLAGLTAGDRAPLAAPGLSDPGSEPFPQLDQLLGFIRERELLLIIDTCEHLIDACARLVDIMLREAPRLTILATTRQPLDAAGEAVLQLRPLPVPSPRSATAGKADAVELFAQRAAAVAPGFTLTPENLDDVVTVCRQLDGIPLAIELAAAQLGALPLPELAERIGDPLRLLADDRHPGPPRHQSLRAAIEWSYSLCTPAERLLWARLSVFAGGFGIAAAEEVCADGDLGAGEILPTLISLVDKNVLFRAGSRDVSPPDEPVFAMLDALREYGTERLGRPGTATVARWPAASPSPATASLAAGPRYGAGGGPAEATVRSRFIAHYLGLAEQFEQNPTTDQPGQYRRLLREHANLRAAFDYALDLPGNDAAAIVLATTLRVYWQISGQLPEGEYWLDRAVARCPKRSVVRARVLGARSIIRVLIGDFANARADAEEAVAMATAFGDLATAGLGYLTLYAALTFSGDLEAAPAGAAAAHCLTSVGDVFGLAQCDLIDALSQMQARELDQCYASAVRGLERLPADEVWCSSYLYLVQSLVLFQRGQADRAKSTGLLGLAMKHRIRDQLGTACALGTQAFIAASQGRHERAAWLLGASGPQWEQVGRQYVGVPVFGALHEVAERMAREAISDDRYSELHAAGMAAPPDYAIARALSDEDQLGDPLDAR
jgi:predicted ATPase